jgi:hypothetical protein
MITFNLTDFTIDAAGPDGLPRRTITGVAVEYNTFATVSDGTTVSFAPGSLPTDGRQPRVFMYHDSTMPVGLVTERVDTGSEMLLAMKISNTALGNEALVLAADGIFELSVGVNPTEFSFDADGNMTVQAADWHEISLVPTAAFASASGSTWTVTAGDPTSLIAAIYDAATDVLAATNFLPDHIFVDPSTWKSLGSQLDADNRPVFPYTGAAGLMGVNGMGTANVTQMNTFNPLGLNLVVDRNFAAGTMVVARASAIEFYEQIRGIMSVDVPATLGRTFSYYGYVSTFIADADQVKSIIIA